MSPPTNLPMISAASAGLRAFSHVSNSTGLEGSVTPAAAGIPMRSSTVRLSALGPIITVGVAVTSLPNNTSSNLRVLADSIPSLFSRVTVLLPSVIVIFIVSDHVLKCVLRYHLAVDYISRIVCWGEEVLGGKRNNFEVSPLRKPVARTLFPVK